LAGDVPASLRDLELQADDRGRLAKAETASFPPVAYGENENRTAQGQGAAWLVHVAEKGAERFLRYLRNAGDPERTPATARDNKIVEVRILEGSAELQAKATAEEFLAAALALGLHENASASWSVASSQPRDATLQGTIRTKSREFGATLRTGGAARQLGAWRD
jgi:hypothetical protein